ncbi:MAG: hypothetical protein LBU23_01190 [Planctomycetota bacterium]|jgi:hypothetical protein|nr:hypothetical protein [Planctomycetota bacterium]
MNRSAFLSLLLAAVLLAPARPEGRAAEAERSQRFLDMIDALDAVSARRAPVIEAIYQELLGQNGGEMRETLRSALSSRNILILQGVAEAMAMAGNPDDLPALEALLATCANLEVKCLVLRMLPAFCLAVPGRARLNYIRYAAGHERLAKAAVLAQLRSPPLDRRGRLLSRVENLRGRAARAIILQFNPVGAAIRYLEDRRYRAAAAETVRHYIANALGNDLARWPRVWESQGGNLEFLVPDEVEEIRLAALQSLSDMGAEGLPETLQALGRLPAGNGALDQAVFETLAGMCSAALSNYPALAAMEATGDEAAGNWRDRFISSTVALALFARERADGALTPGRDAASFAAAAACLGIAISIPKGFPDPDGALARAAEAGLDRLETLLTRPELPPAGRAALLGALGAHGGERAVAAIAGLLASPYVSPEAGGSGLAVAEAAVNSLGNAAANRDGGDPAARAALLALLADRRTYPPTRPGKPPIGLAHLALWRLQRLAKSTDTRLDAGIWRLRLGW